MNRLRELREKKGYSLKKLGEETVMNASVLGNYERGDRNPKQEVWKKLADYFGVSVPYIMGFDITKGKNEVTISKSEYEYLKEIERKYNEIKALVAD